MRHIIRLTVGLFSLLALSCFGGDDGDGLPPSGDNPAQTNDDDSDDCSLSCLDGETLDPAACACLPPNECGVPVDPARLVGKAWSILLGPSTVNQYCESPPTPQVLCSQFGTGLDPIPSVFFEVISAGDHRLQLQPRYHSGLYSSRNETVIPMPSSDFTGNPCFEGRALNFDLNEGDYVLHVLEFYIDAKVNEDLDVLALRTLRLVYDAASLSDLIDGYVCNYGICQPDGTVLIQLANLEAPLVESPAP